MDKNFSNIHDTLKVYNRLNKIIHSLKKGKKTPGKKIVQVIAQKRKILFFLFYRLQHLLNELKLLIFSPIKTDLDQLAIESYIDELLQITIGKNKLQNQKFVYDIVYCGKKYAL